jgi:tetratricopeptide (TPR) repeat protein
MMTLALSLVMTMLLGSGGPQDAAELFAAGNDLYRQGLFEDALVQYDDAGTVGGDPGVLAFNRGNCFFRMGFLGEALHQYLIAERNRPRDGRVARNIAVTTARLGGAIPPRRSFTGLFRKAAGTFRADEYRAAGALLAAIFFIAAAGTLRKGRRPALRLAVLLLLPGLLLYALSAVVVDGPRGRIAVVVKEAAQVYNEPSDGGDALFSLREGEIVAVDGTRGGWLGVSDSEGHRGWARGTEVRRVVGNFVEDRH